MADASVNSRTILEQVRSDLEANAGALATLDASKVDATASATAYREWRTRHEALTAERERLTILKEVLEREAAVADDADEQAKLRQRYEEQVTANAELATRIPAELEKANSILLALIRDVAASAMQDQAINASLPEGYQPLTNADFEARSTPDVPRQEISADRVWLWVRSDNGALIGDQGTVEDIGGGNGRIIRSILPLIRCKQQLFEQIKYHPAEAGQRSTPLWQMRLMPSGPLGVGFDGTEMRHPREVLTALERATRAKGPRQRPIEVELRAIPIVAPREAAEA